MVPMQILIFLFTLYFFVIGFCELRRFFAASSFLCKKEPR